MHQLTGTIMSVSVTLFEQSQPSTIEFSLRIA